MSLVDKASRPVFILNMFQDNKRQQHIMLKQVQHDENLG
jgi:hypothetical protein